ncbi:cytochrome b [Rheinheimera sp.]|uniref:cytochrome b n=1 Tax=Rheinheimera sp. TaxID=1869214 RepID=UPI004047C28C
MWKNDISRYGLISIVLHWITALAVLGLFAVGFWMVDLTYYSQWYRTAPYLHKSIGILLAITICLRLGWRYFSPPPNAVTTHKRWEKQISSVVQGLLYIGMVTLFISGYLISTEDSRPISVFGWFDVPAAGALFDNQADTAGLVHEYVAYSLIALTLLHGAAALKHHFVDKDNTLRRMFGRKP